MNRKKLISAVEQSCAERGYSFSVLDSQALSAQTPSLPAAVLENPTFLSIVGRSHGRITYKVRLSLFKRAAKLSAAQLSDLLSGLEGELLDIFTALSTTSDIAVVEKLTIEPVTRAAIGRGEVGVRAQAEVEIIF